MQHFIDLVTNIAYSFDDNIDAEAFTPPGVVLTDTSTARPSPHHDYDDSLSDWVLIRIDGLKAEIWDAVKDKRAEIMHGGVVFNGNTYQSRDIDVLNAQKVTQASSGALTWPIMVDTADNQRVSLSKANVISIADLIVQLHYNSNENAQSLRADIIAASDPSTVDINSGWPTVPYTGA